MRRYLFVILIFLSPGVVFSTTINVPGDYSTIQQAIDAAANGDTVLVAMGTAIAKITENTITANSLANYPGGQGGGICYPSRERRLPCVS